MRDLLVNAGLQECITYSLTTRRSEAPLSPPPAEYVALLNPISSRAEGPAAHRPGRRAGVARRQSETHRRRAALRNRCRLSAAPPANGCRTNRAAWRLYSAANGSRSSGAKRPGTVNPPLDFFDLKGVIESLTETLHLPGLSYRKSTLGRSPPRPLRRVDVERSRNRPPRRIAPEGCRSNSRRPIRTSTRTWSASRCSSPSWTSMRCGPRCRRVTSTRRSPRSRRHCATWLSS